MKVMISQPMKGKSTEQIRKERAKITEILEKLCCEVANTIFEEEPLEKCKAGVYYLAKSIEAMSKVDAVLFMNGWERARGCQIEHEICLRYDIPTMYEYELIKGGKENDK